MMRKAKIIKKLDERIEKLQVDLAEGTTNIRHQAEVNDEIDMLIDMRTKLTSNSSMDKLIPVILSGLFNIGGILIVLNYEKLDIITSKAFGMIKKS